MNKISIIRNNVGVVIINALAWLLLSREYHIALKSVIARGLSAQNTDLTLAALGIVTPSLLENCKGRSQNEH